MWLWVARHRDSVVEPIHDEVARGRLHKLVERTAISALVVFVDQDDLDGGRSRTLHFVRESLAHLAHECGIVEIEEHVGEIARH